MIVLGDKTRRIEQFQQSTGADVVTAIAYLEAEEFDVSNAITSYRGDIKYGDNRKGEHS